MRYIIETTEKGCVETLELDDGRKFSDEWVKTFGRYQTTGPSLETQLEDTLYRYQILNKIRGIFNRTLVRDFIDLADLIESLS